MAENFPDNSQVWVYGANRFLTDEEQQAIIPRLNEFLRGWAAHGSELSAQSTILHNNFIVLIANEEEVKASGCSIDTSVRFIKELGKTFTIDFFNRLSVLTEKDGQYQRIHFSELSSYSGYTYFDLTVKTLKEFRDGFQRLIP
jgi:hypothetical protein